MEYKVIFYSDHRGKSPVDDYILKQNKKDKVKIFSAIEILRECEGYLEEPYSRHLAKKIRELRVKRHRILYSVIVDKRIILLHAFLKDSQKTPVSELERAIKNYNDFMERSAK